MCLSAFVCVYLSECLGAYVYVFEWMCVFTCLSACVRTFMCLSACVRASVCMPTPDVPTALHPASATTQILLRT
jgi:hypothetical protein